MVYKISDNNRSCCSFKMESINRKRVPFLDHKYDILLKQLLIIICRCCTNVPMLNLLQKAVTSFLFIFFFHSYFVLICDFPSIVFV